jgi:hypothetical protein
MAPYVRHFVDVFKYSRTAVQVFMPLSGDPFRYVEVMPLHSDQAVDTIALQADCTNARELSKILYSTAN